MFELDTGDKLPINALPGLTNNLTKETQTKKTPRHLVDTSARFSYTHHLHLLGRHLCHLHVLLPA